MKSVGKKTLAWFLTVLIAFGAIFVVQIPVSAANNPYPLDGGNGVAAGNCTYTAWEQAYNRMGIALPAWGNAAQWYDRAAASGYQVIPYSTGVVPPANSIACWSGGYGHVAYVVAADSVGMVLHESNIDPYGNGTYLKDLEQWWSYSSWRRNNLQGFIVLQPQDATPPVITNVRVSQLTNQGYTVTCTVTDNEGVNRVQFPTWRSEITSDGCIWYNGVRNGNEWSFTFSDANIATYYTTHIYAYDNAGNYSTAGIEQYVDKTAPVISNVQVSNVTGDGYTVACDIYENQPDSLDRVQFPAWTHVNEQDDIIQQWWTNPEASGELTKLDSHHYHAVYRVNRSDHNNETGEYLTHIYAYDKWGNAGIMGSTPIQILHGSVQSISIASNPSKTVYYVGESFNRSGMTLRVTYQDGFSETIDSGFTVSAGTFSTPGIKSIRVTYQGKSTSFSLTVHKRLPFVDVPASGVYYSDAVQYVYDYDYMTGMNPTTFGPAENLSRAQFAVILYRMKGSPSTAGMNNPFEDNQPGTFYYDAVIWCNNAGIITGYYNADGSFTGRFGPSDNISREQLATMLYRYANYVGDDTSAATSLNRFGDAASVSSYAVDALEWAAAEGIVSGRATNPPTIAPLDNASRADVAVMLQRYLV